MDVLIRYLSNDAIDNCVTCLNYHFDRVIFFGYERVFAEEKSNIYSFLKNDCMVTKIDNPIFIDDLDIKQIEAKLHKLYNSNDNYYIDLTGCEGICQVAFTNFAYSEDKKKQIPMHIYDVRKDLVLNIDNDIKGNISEVKRKKIDLTIETYIKMLGGVVDNRDKGLDTSSPEYKKLIQIKHKYSNVWTVFAYCMGQCQSKDPNDRLHASCKSVSDLLDYAHYEISCKDLMAIINDLKNEGLIKRFSQYKQEFSFYYASDAIMISIVKVGSILEHEVYERELKTSNKDSCKTGIKLDWDGILLKNTDGEVYNEIDVLRLDGYVLTFISCKDTKKLDKTALYELETVNRRFGSKYSKMKLVCTCKAGNSNYNRAKLIGIEIEEFNKTKESE